MGRDTVGYLDWLRKGEWKIIGEDHAIGVYEMNRDGKLSVKANRKKEWTIVGNRFLDLVTRFLVLRDSNGMCLHGEN